MAETIKPKAIDIYGTGKKKKEDFEMKKPSLEDSRNYRVATRMTQEPIPHLDTAMTTPRVEEKPEVQEPTSRFDWGDLLIGATPVLAGLIAGNTEAGYRRGSQGLLSRYEEEKKLNELKQKSLLNKSKEVKGRYQVRPVIVDGKTVYRTYDTAQGKFLAEGQEPVVGRKTQILKDPRTGEYTSEYSAAEGIVRDVKDVSTAAERAKGKRFVKDEKDIEQLAKSIRGDKDYQTANKVMSSSQRAIALLSSNNPIADAGIKTIFPRMFGEVGNLAYQEQERFAGSPSLQRRWESLKAKYESGLLTELDRKDLMEVAEVMYEFDNTQRDNIVESYRDTFRATHKYDPGDITDILKRRPIAKPGKVVRKAKKKVKKHTPKLVKQAAPDGGFNYFEVAPNGKYIFKEWRDK